MYCDRRGNGQKPTRTKPPGQKPPRTIEIEFVHWTFVRDFCTRPTKNGGSKMCDVLSGVGGVPGVWQSVTGGGGQNWPKIVRRTLWTAPYLQAVYSDQFCAPVINYCNYTLYAITYKSITIIHRQSLFSASITLPLLYNCVNTASPVTRVMLT